MGEDQLSDDAIEQELESKVVAVTEKDLGWAWDAYRERIEKVKEKSDGSVNPQMVHKQAIRMVRSAALKGSRSSSGPARETNLVAIGHTGKMQWNDNDNGGKKNVVVGYGIVSPTNEDGEKMPTGIGVFYCDETDGVDLGNVLTRFKPLNTLKGGFSVRQSQDCPTLGDTPVYSCNATDQTRIEETETEKSDEELREFVHGFIEDEATLDNIHNHLSRLNDRGRVVEFGADMKRMVVDIVDSNSGDGWCQYTVLDDSVLPDELSDDVVSERARSPGLTCWVPEEFHKYAEESLVELYGTIEAGDDGQISMNVCGIHPIWATEKESAGGSGGVPDSTTSSVI